MSILAIRLLTEAQKRAGYFLSQAGELVFLWHRRNGNPDCIAGFPYKDLRAKEIEKAVDEDIKRGAE